MKLVERVEEYLHEKSKEIATGFIDSVLDDLNYRGFEEGPILSPVEQLFYIEFHSHKFRSRENEDLNFDLWPQYQNTTTGKYRLDFYIDFLGPIINSFEELRYKEDAICHVKSPNIGVEVDGHI